MEKYILAHDLGTSGNKATLFNEKGKLIASNVTPYQMQIFNSNWAEQDPSIWWDAVCQSSKKVLAEIDRTKVASVVFSGQMMGCLCVDDMGKPLHKALLYCDQRSTEEEKIFVEALGFSRIYEITGHRPSASYTLTKLMWIRKNLSDVYNKTFKVLQAKDYMNFLLTGKYYTDYNDASGTNAFDLEKLAWSEEILNAVGIPVSLFPDAVSSSECIGSVHRKASLETGIPEGTPVIVGAGDGGCASLGAGSVSFGKPYCYMGSSSWVSIASSKPLIDKEMISFTWAHPVAGLYQPCATMQTAGGSFSWFAKTFLNSSEGKVLDRINLLAEASIPGAHGLTFLPYLMGERSPWWNPKAKGAFVGMDQTTNFNDYCRALMEGVSMNLDICLSVMLSEVPDRQVRFIGGGALNVFLRKVLADVFGCQISIPQFLTEATSMGAALLGGVGCGLYPGFDMIELMNPTKEIIEPDMKAHAIYQEKVEDFKSLYKTLEPWFSSR
jgi:xylulokinase